MSPLEELEQIAKSWCETQRKNLDTKDGDWDAVVFLRTPRGVLVKPIDPLLLINDMAKSFLTDLFLPVLIRANKATAYALILSAWTLEVTPPTGETEQETKKKLGAVRPSQHPDRVEKLVLNLVDKTTIVMMTAEIIRSETEAHPVLGEWAVYEDQTSLTGRFVEAPVRALREVVGDATET